MNRKRMALIATLVMLLLLALALIYSCRQGSGPPREDETPDTLQSQVVPAPSPVVQSAPRAACTLPFDFRVENG